MSPGCPIPNILVTFLQVDYLRWSLSVISPVVAVAFLQIGEENSPHLLAEGSLTPCEGTQKHPGLRVWTQGALQHRPQHGAQMSCVVTRQTAFWAG